jgi:hypothetical protein
MNDFFPDLRVGGDVRNVQRVEVQSGRLQLLVVTGYAIALQKELMFIRVGRVFR